MDDETVAMMAEKKAAYVPTLTGMYNFWQREEMYGRKDVADVIREIILEPHRIAVAKCYEKSIRIGVGTDTLGQLNQEIEMLHDCGLPTMACLRAATVVGAEILGLEHEIGTLEVGKKADILVVRGDVTKDITRLRDIIVVVHDGWVADGKTLAEFSDHHEGGT
jgi:imidazolonepropionase-like amidohydrolase